jgi:predicted esterase
MAVRLVLSVWVLAGVAACSGSPRETGYVHRAGHGDPGDSGSGGRAVQCLPASDGGVGGAGGAGIVVDLTPPNPSTGCGKPAPHALEQYERIPITVPGAAANATNRVYYVRLPANYDPGRPYRTVYLGPGCGPIQDLDPKRRKVYPLEQAAGDNAILIALEPGTYNVSDYSTTEFCFDDMASDSVEYPYFEVLHKAIEDAYCVDKERQFYAGYSSGGWMGHQLGCAFPDVLRAQATVTGGLPPSIASCQKKCVDHPIAAFFIHDYNDRSNVFAGSVAARDRLMAENGCAGTTDITAPYQIPGVMNSATFKCVQYTACPAKYPIVFCQSTDQMHNAQTSSAVPGFWDFFSKL